jgi:hypothetical protein
LRSARRRVNYRRKQVSPRRGMNFHNMPELHGRYSYYVLIGVVVLICLGLYRYLRKVRWL